MAMPSTERKNYYQPDGSVWVFFKLFCKYNYRLFKVKFNIDGKRFMFLKLPTKFKPCDLTKKIKCLEIQQNPSFFLILSFWSFQVHVTGG